MVTLSLDPILKKLIQNGWTDPFLDKNGNRAERPRFYNPEYTVGFVASVKFATVSRLSLRKDSLSYSAERKSSETFDTKANLGRSRNSTAYSGLNIGTSGIRVRRIPKSSTWRSDKEPIY